MYAGEDGRTARAHRPQKGNCIYFLELLLSKQHSPLLFRKYVPVCHSYIRASPALLSIFLQRALRTREGSVSRASVPALPQLSAVWSSCNHHPCVYPRASARRRLQKLSWPPSSERGEAPKQRRAGSSGLRNARSPQCFLVITSAAVFTGSKNPLLKGPIALKGYTGHECRKTIGVCSNDFGLVM